jgi:hypothetical protein
MHQTQSFRYLIGFSNEKSAGRRYKQCFLLDKSCRNQHTTFSAVLRQQRKSDVMTSFGHSARSTIHCKAGSSLLVFECNDYFISSGDRAEETRSYIRKPIILKSSTRT